MCDNIFSSNSIPPVRIKRPSPGYTPDYERLYQITAHVTPLAGDCGQLCGKACCQPDATNSLGIYLFPGEEAVLHLPQPWLDWEMHDPRRYDFPASWQEPVHFVKCTRPCPRTLRPLACRFFPLAPHLLRDGQLLLIYETMSLPYRCPLIVMRSRLERQFIETTAAAWRELLQNRQIYDLVWEDSRQREAEGTRPELLWPAETRNILQNPV
ncbi:hypothetical protein [Desulfurispora thermophila]|uniref:hypothetical protein n=1 Tax=Desulfurispora thermophila TaxID=265470 RepID=UPI000365FDBA|nr:hypothetical protein [Desulfurispora thermophila]